VRDFWANMIMLYCLQSYYEYSGDERVIDLMTKYFKYQLSVPDEQFLSEMKYWQRIRGGDNLHSVLCLYNRTGEDWLMELAEKVHRNTAPWSSRGHSMSDIGNPKHVREGMEWPEWYRNLIDWHNVNVAQAFREPAQYYQLSHDEKDLQAT
jgi:rhamnogalacturonyl hydrolase YesR